MSQMSREDMLRELELLPVWQLRQPLPTPFKIETPAVAYELIVKEQQPEPAVVELLAIETVVVESLAPELSGSEQLIAEQSISDSAPFKPPALEVLLPQQTKPVESVEIASAPEPVLAPALPLRLLLSEDSVYAFLIEPYAADADMQEVETLLKNMMRAMQVSCRVDVTDKADKIFAAHTPKLIISLGAAPANQLSGKMHVIDEWRNMQQPLYENIPIVVTYHPAHLLQNPGHKAHAWRDLCAAMQLVQNL